MFDLLELAGCMTCIQCIQCIGVGGCLEYGWGEVAYRHGVHLMWPTNWMSDLLGML